MSQSVVPDHNASVSDLTSTIGTDPSNANSVFAPPRSTTTAPLRGRPVRTGKSKRNHTQTQLPFSVTHSYYILVQ